MQAWREAGVAYKTAIAIQQVGNDASDWLAKARALEAAANAKEAAWKAMTA